MFTMKKSLRIVMWRQLCYILGKLHFRSAETLLFIEDRSTLSTQLRLSMFKGDAILGGGGGNRDLFLAQNCLKRIMCPLLDF